MTEADLVEACLAGELVICDHCGRQRPAKLTGDTGLRTFCVDDFSACDAAHKCKWRRLYGLPADGSADHAHDWLETWDRAWLRRGRYSHKI